MFIGRSRRHFLQTTGAAGALAALGDLGFMSRLSPVSAAEAKAAANIVPLQPEIEPLVRLVEETPRDKLLEEVAQRIQRGTSYREVLAALQLAGVRNVQPRPEVGFKFHSVLVVNSAHLASLSSPDEHRWLPIFWALDYFKETQAQDEKEGNWTMRPVDESAMPSASKARSALITALDRWDEAAADVAAAALVRSAGADEVYELLYRYGGRDFRSIGHKAIFVANSRRTLECIGWQHAEPVVRSLVYAMLLHEGDNPADRDGAPDRPWRQNRERAAKFRSDWLDGKLDSSATSELLATLRTGSADDACDKVVELVNRGVACQSIWDALFLGSGELLVRQSGIVALHAVTSTNAFCYAWRSAADDDTRRMLLLQNAAFLPLFREAMQKRGEVKPFQLDQLQPTKIDQPEKAISEIFTDINKDELAAAGKVLAYTREHPQPKELIDAARVLIFLKGTNAHDYKFSSAVLEDFSHVSPEWRARYLASSVFNLRGSGDKDNRLVERTRAALA